MFYNMCPDDWGRYRNNPIEVNRCNHDVKMNKIDTERSARPPAIPDQLAYQTAIFYIYIYEMANTLIIYLYSTKYKSDSVVSKIFYLVPKRLFVPK